MKAKRLVLLGSFLFSLFSVTSCGEVEQGHLHTYGDWTVVKEATCLDKGSEKAKCTTCGKETTRAISALGHDITEWAYSIEPTCITGGKEERHCSRCDTKTEERDVEALGHNYSEYEIISEPTCTLDGLKKRVCARCDVEDKVVLEKLGHDVYVSKEAKGPTCLEGGWTEETKCRRCNEVLKESRTLDALGHDYEITYTCNEDSTKCYAKAVCKNNSSEVYEETSDVTSTVKKEATCLEDGKATYTFAFTNLIFETQNFDVALPALGHDFTVVSTNPSTCSSNGSESRHCNRCELDYTVELPLAEHTPEIMVQPKEATCTEDGYTAKIICHECAYILQNSVTVKAYGHNYEVTSTTESNCEKGGTITKTCSRCGDVQTITLEKTSHVDEDNDLFCDNCTYFMESETATKITDSVSLAAIALNDSSACYVLENDIALNSFVPLGSQSKSFDGIFYGNGHTITFEGCKNLEMSGLFYRLKGKVVSLNVSIPSFSTENIDCKAGFISIYNSGLIKNCKVTGSRSYKFKTTYNIQDDNRCHAEEYKNTFSVGELVYTNESTGKIIDCKIEGNIQMESNTNSHQYVCYGIFEKVMSFESDEHLYVTQNEEFACLATINKGRIENCDVNSLLTHTGLYEVGTGYSISAYAFYRFTMNQKIASLVSTNSGVISSTRGQKFEKPTVTIIYHDPKSTHNTLNEYYIFNTVYPGLITVNNGSTSVIAY